MKATDDTFKVFSRRIFVIGGIQMIGLGVLGSRLAYLQVAQGGRYKMLADKNRISIRMIGPSRGAIIDRFGVPLAINEQNYRVLLVPEQTENIQALIADLQKYIALDQSTIDKVIKQSKQTAKFIPIKVKEDLSWEEVAKIELNLPDLPGLLIDTGEVRRYPLGQATAHVIGYVGAVSEKELKEQGEEESELNLPGFKVGKLGVEKQFDTQMRGKAGAAEVEVNVVGREVRELRRTDPTSGGRVTLTIDAELQRYAQEVLGKERSASAVVMDCNTGAVYALTSHPSFDPNIFSRGIPQDLWQMLLADPALPLTNKALAGQYPPGSTFKMITALAGLESGAITSGTTAFCPGHYSLGKQTFHCWKKGGHGTVVLTQALQKSCDTFFYKAANDIGIDNIAAMARRFGLGTQLGFELTEERPGLIPDKSWKYARFSDKWHPGETIVASIGQGYILTTPLQLAVMTARIVNGGYAVKPWITHAIGGIETKRETWKPIGIKEEYLALVRKGMEKVVNEQEGTAFSSRIDVPGMLMGGKTGTAQVQRITKQQRTLGVKNEELPWEQRHHALFVGYAPIESPKYVCVVVVEHGVGGSKAAAPIARDLLLKAQMRDPILSRLQIEKTQAKDND